MAHTHQYARREGRAVIRILADGQRLTLSTKDDLLVCHHATGANRVNRNAVDGGAALLGQAGADAVERIGERQTLVRLTAPVPGILNVFTYGEDEGQAEEQATAGVRAYLFSADAADYVRRQEPAWQAWLQGLSVPA